MKYEWLLSAENSIKKTIQKPKNQIFTTEYYRAYAQVSTRLYP